MPPHLWAVLATIGVAIVSAIIVMIRKVERMEAKLDNGLTGKITLIEERQTSLVMQVSEMHGWMKATYGWKGKERRQ